MDEEAEKLLETLEVSHGLTVPIPRQPTRVRGDRDPDCSSPGSFVSNFALQPPPQSAVCSGRAEAAGQASVALAFGQPG